MKKRILYLTLKKVYFDQIALDKKKVEYRQIKPYWIKRLLDEKGRFRKFDEVWFRNGYKKNSPFMRVECKSIGFKDDSNYAIHLGKILEIKNWKKD